MCSSKSLRFLQWFFCYLRAASNFTCNGAVFFTHFSPYHFQLLTTVSTVVMLAYFRFILCKIFLDNSVRCLLACFSRIPPSYQGTYMDYDCLEGCLFQSTLSSALH
ncbi:hypothetical protein Peur_022842 [Populus x canadensis]